jgi:calcium-binding protein CML
MTSNDSMPDGELKKLFNRFDTDLNEQIDVNEFRKMLQSLGHESIAEVLDLEFASIDTDGDGRVKFEEFANWWRDYEEE